MTDKKKLFEDLQDKGEKPDITKWGEHVDKRHVIENFSTLTDGKLYIIRAENEGEVLLPFQEYYGDHSMNYVILWDNKNKKEILRKNLRFVDMVTWEK